MPRRWLLSCDVQAARAKKEDDDDEDDGPDDKDDTPATSDDAGDASDEFVGDNDADGRMDELLEEDELS